MEWLTGILGLVGGGWGSFAAIVALGIAAFFFMRAWNKAKQDKADKETKDKAVEDHGKIIDKNDAASGQAKKDDAANEEALNKLHQHAWFRKHELSPQGTIVRLWDECACGVKRELP